MKKKVLIIGNSAKEYALAKNISTIMVQGNLKVILKMAHKLLAI